MLAARKIHELRQEEFDRLLNWLDADRDRAAELYEKIRWRLIAILAARGCRVPEELADETIDRVARRVPDIESTYVGDKAIYFLGVMNNVHHEHLKRPPVSPTLKLVYDNDGQESALACLDKCLEQLTPRSRVLIEQYYAADKRARIDLRKRIAETFGVRAGTLRLRALRIRQKLQVCVNRCIQVAERERATG